ncbi:MAG: prepilin-type N-terminal cleavage/methylation domain-containing protein [Bacilli bacterium]|nr:prepilin-type N-terminal cleavage/methylation domain-containing protein [Bacilli bacterium]
MLKKIKGFSLVELIIAIALLASIGLLIGLNFNKIFNKEEKGSYEEYVNNIKSAADLYLSSNNSLLTELNTNKGYIIITIKQIKEAGLLSSDLINPTTKEPVLDDELVTVSLDANGLYKFTYPGVKKEEYLQTITKTIDYGKEFNCLSDLDTINLGLIDKNGNLKINYFNNSPSYISCDKETIDTKEIGNHVITYNYVNSEGVTKEAKRNFVVIDHISPTVTSVDYSPKGWTKGDVTISANINDNESGIGYYTINLNKCDNFKKTNANSITEVISQNGQYSVCAKDISGNVTESKLTISNIDKTLPVINNIKQFTVGLGITATIADNQSKVVAYAINQTSNESSVTWTNISATASTNISKAVAKIGTYYIWAKDLAGNVSKKSFVVVDNIKPTVTNVKATPTAWTKGNVTISASISDNESGIASYAINLNSCGTYTSTTAATISKTVSANGTYSVCAKDVAGNVTENKITISNIDKTLPVINNIKQFTVGLGITATIADNQSKVVAYAINQTSNESSVTWTNISATASTNISKAVAKIGTYYIWAKDLAGNVSKKSFVVVDNIKPTVTNVKATPTAWTKGNVTISASISDNESGIASYAINLNSCGTYTSTTAATISKTVSANGTYSVCAKDVAGNVTENKITISNIDKTLPVINTISKSTSQWVTSLTISTTISDNQSKIIAYAVNKTSSEASVSWTSITEVTSRSISYTVTANGTYYIWAKDKAGNVSYKSIIINNIGTLKTVSFSTDDLSSSSYSGSYNTGSTIKAINSITVNNGTVGSYSYSGTRIYYSLSGGTRRSGSYSTTCSTSASSTSKKSNTYCASYSCPNGGSLSESTCSGSTLKVIEGGCTWKCVNGNITNWSCTDNGCPDGYTKGEWACGSPSCPYTSVFCANACYKSYSYTATCNSKTEYYCPDGYEEVGSSCYKCSKGSLSGTSCHYSCTESYTYYWYRVDVEYII